MKLSMKNEPQGIRAILLVLLLLAGGYAWSFHALGNLHQETGDRAPGAAPSSQEEIKEKILLGESYWQTDKGKSYEIVSAVFDMLRTQHTSDTILGDAYHLLGKLLIDRGELDAGIDTLKQCLRIKMRAYGTNDAKLSKTINYIGLGFRQAVELDSAMFYYTWAARVVTDNNLVNKDLYFTYQNRGLVQIVLGKLGLSYSYFEKAKNVLDSIATPDDDVMRANFYKSFGYLTTLNGKLNEANEYYNKAEEIYIKNFGSNYSVLADIYTYKGLNVYYNYEFDEAIIHFQKAIDILNANDAPYQHKIALYSNLSTVAFKKGDFEKSIYYSRKGFTYDAQREGKLILLLNLSRSYEALGNMDSAAYYFDKAIDFSASTRLLPDKVITLQSAYSEYLFSINQYPKSRYYIDQALAESDRFYGKVSEISAELTSRLGDYHFVYTHDMDSALYYYDRSIEIWEQRLSQPEQYAKTWTLAETGFMDTYSGRAGLFLARYRSTGDAGHLINSIGTYRALFGHTDMVTGKITREGTLLFNNKIKSVYIQAIEVAFLLFRETGDEKYLMEAFEFSEKSKSALLLNTVRSNRALQIAGVPEHIVEMEARMQEEINSLRKIRDEEQARPRVSESRIAFFNTKLIELYDRHDSMIASIEKEYPRYFSLKYDHSVISLADVKQSLGDADIVLEYTLSDSNLYIIAIDQEDVVFRRIAVDSSFYEAMAFLTGLKNKRIMSMAEDDPRVFVKHSGLLWKYLIEPVEKSIQGKHLIIIPDEQLGYLSFDILVNPWSSSVLSSYRELPYLIRQNTLSYAYSSTLKYGAYFMGKSNPRGNAIAFATDYDEPGLRLPGKDIYDVLNYAILEAEHVSRIMGGKTYTNEKATKHAFIREAPNYSIIHLALHTRVNDSMPLFSELIFSGDKDDTLDNQLMTYELYGMNLSADLVTLSACNSGTGKLQRGEGIMNLARGFLYAGVPSVIMTLWEVQDESSTQIMKNFYAYLKEGYQKDKAMQLAKLDYLSEANMLKSHPYFWSLFVVSGETTPLVLHRARISNYLYLGLAIVVLLLVYGLFKRKSAGSG